MNLYGAPSPNREPFKATLTREEYDLWVRDLIQSVPVMYVDTLKAHMEGNAEGLAYDEAMKHWLADAAHCLMCMAEMMAAAKAADA